MPDTPSFVHQPFNPSPFTPAPAYTFDDVLLQPRHSAVLPSSTGVATVLCDHLPLRLPILSAAMDTVTESAMAIALAQAGGLGVIHKNLSITAQVEKVARVKRFEAGVLKDPLTVTSSMTIGELAALAKDKGVSGFPVVENGQLLGLITRRDWRFEDDMSVSIAQRMTAREHLVTLPEGATAAEAKRLMHQHKLERIVLLKPEGTLAGLMTVQDLQKAQDHPDAARDAAGRLQAAAAIGVGEEALARADALVKTGVDLLVVDTAHGHSAGVIEQVRALRHTHGHAVALCAGNIATAQAALELAQAGADVVKVGIGPGSICTTRIVAGVGVPQLSAIHNVAQGLAHHLAKTGKRVGLIADGGIRYSGDIAKALAAGADAVMLGSMLAGCEEAPGEVEVYNGRYFKSYRGMGSIGAMRAGSADRYFQSSTTQSDKLVPEGVEGRVPYKGAVAQVLHQMAGGLKASMGYCGAADLAAFRANAEFVVMTAAGSRESHVHDVVITQEAPNYSALGA